MSATDEIFRRLRWFWSSLQEVRWKKDNYPTIPENSEVLSLTRANGICYVDYNSVFQDYALDVSEQIAVYSVVNTLIAATDVDKLRFPSKETRK